ncbi:MAG: sigma 54-interacting transcriptional regulator [Gammaproteobacteria bacterium]|nr:sigma 54-interacting transcriptional regulator [Gammaproteobacteria bacterium]MDP2140335.1 sigma 54-interacting transcriptional regulator [Gammaproteobacteria bacterium]MDP2346148.1 sigma 54-interacting transcriptional regulator [Gammaproteobacteria bacterium]
MTNKRRILLVDDDADLLHLISVRLKANGFDINAVNSAETALTRLSVFRPHVVVTDLRMPGMDGMELFELIQQRNLRLPVIMLTAHGTIPEAVAATQKGVFSYLVKPFDAQTLLAHIEKALLQSGEMEQPEGDVSDRQWRSEIISCSHVMENLLQQTRAAAVTDVSVLIQSQTGTGKELLAGAVHKASARRDKPFMALNCAAMPEALLESELFGHVAGSFTGAHKTHTGLFQAANRGTVFLDEIGDMPIAAQAKLLRVLEQHEVRPVGSTETIAVDVRIIAATHHDLAEKVAQGTFREDLFYRLNVITLELPPLSERREDISLLANHFCQMLSARHGKGSLRFAPEAMELLVSAPWPGNVRQLLNIVEQCVVLSSTPLISRALAERALRFKPDRLIGLNQAREQFEHDYLLRLLNMTEGNIALAARLSERNRSEFYNLLRRHGLDPAQFRKVTE